MGALGIMGKTALLKAEMNNTPRNLVLLKVDRRERENILYLGHQSSASTHQTSVFPSVHSHRRFPPPSGCKANFKS